MSCQSKATVTHQEEAESTPNLVKLAIRVIAAKARIFSLLSAAAALFLFVGSAHGQGGGCTPSCDPTTGLNCILVTNFQTGYVEQFDECGNLINSQFINANGSAEGVSCTISGTNTAWVANNTGTISLYNLATGQSLNVHSTIGTSSA